MSAQFRADVNSLLALLRQYGVLQLVDDHFLYDYGNPAPGESLHQQMTKVQKHLDAKED